jgi:protein-S-isoprenylcysteine O-methyltransferase Ste14
LYTHVRHPIYTGVLLGAYGAAVFQGEIITLLLAIALTILFDIKSRYEESLLKTAFAGYAQYMMRTGRFVPGINL